MADYFTDQTDEYINKFLQATTIEEKHRLFNEGIKPAFEKLIENLIFVYKFFTLDNIDTLKKDCLTNLYEMLPKFKPDKAKKGFSYFNVVAKNWFIQKSKENIKKNRIEREVEIQQQLNNTDSNKATSLTREDIQYVSTPSYEDAVLEKEFWLSLTEEMETWRIRVTKKSERALLEAIIFLMNNSELVSIYNKKAIFLYLREMTGLNEKQVALTLKKLKILYVEYKKVYHTDDQKQ